MAKIKHLFFLLVMLASFGCNTQKLTLGVERTEIYFPLLKGKSVGVIGNQTSMISDTHLIDSLLSLKIDVVKVFSPEHGFRGIEEAGANISNEVDSKTDLTIVSLYGRNKKPTLKELTDIEILVFDIQDVGARFYTYISTLHYVMEAAAENNIPLIILDRPNPNGHYVDGPILDTDFRSFVGMHPIPIVHGMTIGEYAKMINGEHWISTVCNLTIVEMEYYTHNMHYDLPIKPSPNLPNSRSVNLYPSLCLFEGTTVSIGRGTDYPFQHFGAPYLNSEYSFTPKSGEGSKYPKNENKICYGTDLRFQEIYLATLNLNWLISSYNNCPNKEKFFNPFFDKLAGNNVLRKQIIEGKNAQEIKATWQNNLLDFKRLRMKYLLYL
mgnify:CR=1 FL=1